MPARSTGLSVRILKAVCVAFAITVSVYLLATLAVTRSGIDPAALDIDHGGFPVLGVLVGGSAG